jgi:ribosomal 50S subunit-associated protein YjgA (DUF615 family)
MARKKFQWSRDEEDAEGELHFTERANRSDQKREVKRIDALAKELVTLLPDQLNRLELPEPVAKAVAEAQRIKAKGRVRSGMRRQMLFLSGVLRHIDDEPLTVMIEHVEQLNRKRR